MYHHKQPPRRPTFIIPGLLLQINLFIICYLRDPSDPAPRSIPAIREATAALTEDLIATVRAAGFTPKVAAEPERRSAIVMIPMPDPAASVRHLAAGGVIADSRPGHVRFSPFFYNVQDDYVRATERLAAQPAH